MKVLTLTFQPCEAKSTPFLALGTRLEIVRKLSLPTKRPWRDKKGGQAAKSACCTPEMPWSPGAQCVLYRGHCAARQSTLATHWKLQDRLPTQTNPALILPLPFLSLRKRGQDYGSHLEVLWAASAARRCFCRSRRPCSPCSHCSSTGFCRSNTRAASLLAQSLANSQPTC